MPGRLIRFPTATLLGALLYLTPGISVSPAAEEVVANTVEKRLVDFDEILENRHLRALVVYNKLLYFLDGPTQRGASYDALEQFREFIDKKYDLGARRFQVVYIPVTRERLIPSLLEGIGDVAVANLTITPERLAQVDFTDPIAGDVREVVVTGPNSPAIGKLEDLAGKKIAVRLSSSYYQSLLRLNDKLAEQGLDPVELIQANEYLEDVDILEMVNAGLWPMAIVDSHKADFWKDLLTDIIVHDDVAISEGQEIGWAFRKNSPILKDVLNQFVSENRKGTLIGNVILKRYFKDNKWARNNTGKDDVEKLRVMIDYFRQYADDYTFDWLMLAALGYQESRLDQSTRSAAGAVGVMQLLPSTAADPNVGIPDIEDLQNNIHAGTKYLRFIRDRYFEEPEIDDFNATLLTFASYNAGPNKIASLRKEAAEAGLDPNVWFGNVEHIVARRIGRETVQYVSNISKYYIAYKLLVEGGQLKEKALEESRKQTID